MGEDERHEREDPPTPAGPRSQRFEVEGREFAVLSFPEPEAELPDCLSAAEQGVCRAVLAGHSNHEIASLRGASERTVANQVAAILRKLGISSRAEIPVALGRRHGPYSDAR